MVLHLDQVWDLHLLLVLCFRSMAMAYDEEKCRLEWVMWWLQVMIQEECLNGAHDAFIKWGPTAGGRGFQILNGFEVAPFSALSWNAYFLGCSRLYTWRHSLSSKYNM